MAIRHNIQESELGDQLVLTIDSAVNSADWKDGGRMLVDSDQLSFIYVMETDTELIYIGIPHEAWGHLSAALTNELTVILQAEENRTFELASLHTELAYLLDNIQDNSNYGEEMLKAVEASFADNIK